ncbi:hypothetical protein RhiirA5_467883 [Rhizophagus irregularis]|uniref:MARVEL domain-containing protein n=3 Tax=Rhizophagus irregularis TaxID=588596 RepID=A0A2I1EGP4_9GLOM|nr:hypothetical protein GLOIN_2v1475432 [Rhizophagus irregularis DAOM 181602=DAOM 197198]PKC11338.1 hypothetical protein RhiirA5_467883 [Rhizophagus irregularis]PKC66737.1 hypothetical protein RhiirA1_418951 [Rhizophagus irregularis]PKY21298.1 hypothetical protein RhiirB3_409332 [Rhizophagus irregularis]POG75524.1 hypothetical protein GLOIN_2v1475432 [Rhizophagus irregularis DAOM 181602=DAOM 197198]UZO09418.1 hypothetical protein OCT59_029645 [Rhizophagus irregularis]|eukprot:XP_025182390.1 hypothetical protein GLOIN_2v1475432 [Rhizophagus irregularis DAOM 181602=DAOM 197198]
MAYDETDKIEIPITKLQWGFRGAQILFALLATFTISAVIGWDNKFFSASLFSVFFLFFLLLSTFFAAAIVGIPHLYNTKGKFKNAARALGVPRFEFVLSAIWAVLIFIFTFLLSIDAFALRKCDPSDPKYSNYTTGPSNQTFYSGLPNACRTQRAANAFGWFALTAWLCSLALTAKDWYTNRRPPVPQEPITYDKKPSNISVSSSLDEQGLPDTSAQHQENVPMQTIHPQPHPQQQQFQPSPTFPQQQFQQTSPPIFPHQQTFNSPPLAPTPGPAPPFPQPQIPGQGQGQGQGQEQPPISFPEPKHF